MEYYVTVDMKKDRVMAEEVCVTGVTLLTYDEAKTLPKKTLFCDDWWWLRSPGLYRDLAAIVDTRAMVSDVGNSVNDPYGLVRPALKVKGLRIGDRFELFGFDWSVVLPGLALCDSEVDAHRFDEDSNDWKGSELKAWLDGWLKDMVSC